MSVSCTNIIISRILLWKGLLSCFNCNNVLFELAFVLLPISVFLLSARKTQNAKMKLQWSIPVNGVHILYITDRGRGGTQKPKCVICQKVLTNESLKPRSLQEATSWTPRQGCSILQTKAGCPEVEKNWFNWMLLKTDNCSNWSFISPLHSTLQ